VRIDWSAHALSDLRAISDYIELDRNLETANRVTSAIYESILVCKPCLTAGGRAASKTHESWSSHDFLTSQYIRFSRNEWWS
jgi:hypothetical protein